MRSLLAASLILCAPLVGGCIERPWAEAPQKASVDRSQLRDVLIAATPAAMQPVGASFGDGAVELVGYSAEPAVLVPGQRTRITLFWRCKAEVDAWHVFVHLDDMGGSGERIHAEHDPANGRYPTDVWQPNDLIADSFTVVPGRNALGLFLGFYNQGETRLKLDHPGRGKNDGNNRLLAGVLPMVH